MSDRGYTEKEIEEVKRRLYYSYLYDKSAKASAIPDAGILFRYIADLEVDAEKFREMWGTLQAFHNVWVSDYADPADREEDLRKELCRIAQYVEEFACVQHDWTAWTEDTFFRSRSCKNCLATESVRIKQSPESLRNYEKWKADSKRIDKFLYLGLCLNVEGFHPLSREEMDKFLDSQEFRMKCEAEWDKIRNE